MQFSNCNSAIQSVQFCYCVIHRLNLVIEIQYCNPGRVIINLGCYTAAYLSDDWLYHDDDVHSSTFTSPISASFNSFNVTYLSYDSYVPELYLLRDGYIVTIISFGK